MHKLKTIKALNNIDRLVDEALLKPLKTAPEQYTPWWSPVLHT